jgi:hypothetical protein
MHPSSSRASKEIKKNDLKHPCSVDLRSINKTNKPPCFIERYDQLNSKVEFGTLMIDLKY